MCITDRFYFQSICISEGVYEIPPPPKTDCKWSCAVVLIGWFFGATCWLIGVLAAMRRPSEFLRGRVEIFTNSGLWGAVVIARSL